MLGIVKCVKNAIPFYLLLLLLFKFHNKIDFFVNLSHFDPP